MDFSSSPLRPRVSGRSWMALPNTCLQFIRAHKTATTIVVVLALGFYWYQLRPIVIARFCATQASMDARQLLKSKAEISKEKETRDSYLALAKKNMYLRSDYDSFLQKCLLHYGFQISNLQKATDAAASSAPAKK